jgi:hypothetical protein
MLDQEYSEPGSLSPELREQLFTALRSLLERLEFDPTMHQDLAITHQTNVGVQQIAAYLDGPPGGERRNTDD